jgi:mRNA-degrading endonuclease RelE of RelBE toxin-antitoxin system
VWKNPKVGECPCYPTQKLLETLGKAIDEIIRIKGADLALELGSISADMFESVDKIMESAGFKKIGSGSYRLAYEFKDDKGCDCVVKVAKSKSIEFREPNYKEVEVMNEIPDDIRDFFLPIGASDEQSWWVTQPKASIPESYARRWELVAELESKLKEKGWRCLDLHDDNVGLYANKPVILDYGRGLKCRRRTRTRLQRENVSEAVETPNMGRG